MELKDFIGKTVISIKSKKRYVLDRITAPEIRVHTEKLNEYGDIPIIVGKATDII